MSDAILTVNAGSSSIKFALFGAAPNLPRIATGAVSKIGEAPHLAVRDSTGAVVFEKHWDSAALSHEDLILPVLDWVDTHLGSDELIAAGHRIVHGGEKFFAPVRLDEAALTELATLTPLAPLHEPHNLAAVQAVMALRKNLPQIGCFDTAFHHDMPVIATRIAIPRHYFDEGFRRYGFHGLSYEYISRRLREVAPHLAAGKVIAAHLGNGASVCAMANGKSIDSSMGVSALDGLMMGTRCGIIDAGALLYFLQARGMSADELSDMLYKKSGLLGVSNISADMQVLEASTDPAAAEAIALFVFHAARQISAIISSLGGLNGLVFTAGIGENDASVRAAICARLAWLGLEIDSAANAKNAALISTPQSNIEIHVIPTDEEAMIVRHCLDLLQDSLQFP
jgi:acetate kinase